MALVNPHGGGDLKPLLLEGEDLIAELKRARAYPKVTVSSREKGDLIMLGIGGFTPLDGFMTHADWQGVCDGMTMTNGLFWPIPITLSTNNSYRRCHPHRQRHRAGRSRGRQHPRHDAGHREIQHRQGA